MIKALMMKSFRPEDLEQVSGISGYDFTYAAEPTAEQLAEAEVLLGQPSAAQLEQAKSVKWVQTPNAGVDGYVKNGFPAGVTLTNVSGAFGQSISEFVLAMTLTLYKKLHRYRDNQREALWQDEGWQQTPAGKNLLIIGAGDIGTRTAALFRPFGCHITGVRRVPRKVPEHFDEMITLEGLDEALPKADIVVCALPATPATIGLMNRERLALLKPTAVLINVGRGNLIDCDALAEQLNAGRLLGAALDVTAPEPLPTDHPLWRCRDAVITPHITGGSFGHLQETSRWIYDLCRENLQRYRDGEELRNIVDLTAGYRRTQE